MPNGRDGEDGTGHSPKARRRSAPTRRAFPNVASGAMLYL